MLTPLEVWSQGEADTAAKSNLEVEAVNRAMLQFAGFESMQTLGGTTLVKPQEPQVQAVVWVRITGDGTQDGVYEGAMLNMDAGSDIDPDSVTPGDIGTETDETVVVINKGPEVGVTGHALTESPANASDFPGTVVGSTNENPSRLVVVINGVDIKGC